MPSPRAGTAFQGPVYSQRRVPGVAESNGDNGAKPPMDHDLATAKFPVSATASGCFLPELGTCAAQSPPFTFRSSPHAYPLTHESNVLPHASPGGQVQIAPHPGSPQGVCPAVKHPAAGPSG